MCVGVIMIFLGITSSLFLGYILMAVGSVLSFRVLCEGVLSVFSFGVSSVICDIYIMGKVFLGLQILSAIWWWVIGVFDNVGLGLPIWSDRLFTRVSFISFGIFRVLLE